MVAFQTTGMDLLWSDEPATLPLGWNRVDGFVGINDLEAVEYYERLLEAGKPLVTLSARLPGAATALSIPRLRNASINPAM